MLVSVEEQARAAGAERVLLDCRADDIELQRFYEGQGYYPQGVDSDAPMLLRLAKDLPAAGELVRCFEAWEPELVGTLLFVIDADRVLLIRKKTGHGAGKINAPGGKLEPGETPAACAVRETFEEVGVRVEDPRLMARLKFADTVASQWFGYVYVSHAHAGVATASREADPRWYAVGAVPYEQMWQDDRIWLPRVLAGERVEGEFLFDAGELRAHRLT